MAVLPQFDPAQAPSTLANVSVQGQNAQQSWMNQAQNRQIQAQSSQIQRQQADNTQALFESSLPVVQAKNQADFVSTQQRMDAMARTQKFREQAATDGPALQDEYLNNSNVATNEDGSPDWQGQYETYRELLGRYNSLNLLPEWKPLMDQVNGGMKNAYAMMVSHQVADNALAKVQALNEGKVDVENIRSTTRQNVALDQDQTKLKTAGIYAGARTGAAQAGATARTGAADTQAQAKVKAAQVKEWGIAAQARETAAQALDQSDPAKAKQLRDEAKTFRDKIDSAGQPQAQTPQISLSTVNVKGDQHVVVDGQAYPLLRNKKTGEVAYMGPDGKRHPVPTEAPADSTDAEDEATLGPDQ